MEQTYTSEEDSHPNMTGETLRTAVDDLYFGAESVPVLFQGKPICITPAEHDMIFAAKAGDYETARGIAKRMGLRHLSRPIKIDLD